MLLPLRILCRITCWCGCSYVGIVSFLKLGAPIHSSHRAIKPLGFFCLKCFFVHITTPHGNGADDTTTIACHCHHERTRALLAMIFISNNAGATGTFANLLLPPRLRPAATKSSPFLALPVELLNVIYACIYWETDHIGDGAAAEFWSSVESGWAMDHIDAGAAAEFWDMVG
jgi:hypothetical protein